METILQFLKDCQTFYLATADGGQPRVRPLGAAHVFEGKLYICTNNTKPMFKQMKANPRVEISGTAPDGRWLRLTAEAVPDGRPEARKAMLDALPTLRGMYKEDDGIFEVLYLTRATGVIQSFSGVSETRTF